jgi:hypothetical protein
MRVCARATQPHDDRNYGAPVCFHGHKSLGLSREQVATPLRSHILISV